jgi:predicted NACHT family NTPase
MNSTEKNGIFWRLSKRPNMSGQQNSNWILAIFCEKSSELNAGPTSFRITKFLVTDVTENLKLRAPRIKFLLKRLEQTTRDIYFALAISNNSVIT